MRIAVIYTHLGGIQRLRDGPLDLLVQIHDDLYGVKLDSMMTGEHSDRCEGRRNWRQACREVHAKTEVAFRRSGWERYVLNVRSDHIFLDGAVPGLVFPWHFPKLRFRETTKFLMNGVAMEVRFTHHSYVMYDLFSKFANLQVRNKANLGIVIVPVGSWWGFPPHITSFERVTHSLSLLKRHPSHDSRSSGSVAIGSRFQAPFPTVILGTIPGDIGPEYRDIPVIDEGHWTQVVGQI